MPKAELKTKTNPNGHHPVAVWVRFGFQLGSLEKKCSGLRGEPCRLHSVQPICPISHLWLISSFRIHPIKCMNQSSEMTMSKYCLKGYNTYMIEIAVKRIKSKSRWSFVEITSYLVGTVSSCPSWSTKGIHCFDMHKRPATVWKKPCSTWWNKS